MFNAHILPEDWVFRYGAVSTGMGCPFFFEGDNLLRKYSHVALLSPDKIKKIWLGIKPEDEKFIETPFEKQWGPGKIREVIEGVTGGPSMRLPATRMTSHGFGDGRHRTKFLIDHATPHIPMQAHDDMLPLLEGDAINPLYPLSAWEANTSNWSNYRNNVSPFTAWGKNPERNPLHIVCDYERLAMWEGDCISTREELLKTHLGSELMYHETRMRDHSQLVLDAIGEWRAQNGLTDLPLDVLQETDIVPPNWRPESLPVCHFQYDYAPD